MPLPRAGRDGDADHRVARVRGADVGVVGTDGDVRDAGRLALVEQCQVGRLGTGFQFCQLLVGVGLEAEVVDPRGVDEFLRIMAGAYSWADDARSAAWAELYRLPIPTRDLTWVVDGSASGSATASRTRAKISGSAKTRSARLLWDSAAVSAWG